MDAQIAALADLNSAPKDVQVALKKTAIEKTNSDIEQNYKNFDDSLRNISINANDIVKNKFANIFDGSNIQGYRIKTTSCDSYLESSANAQRKSADDSVTNLENISQNYNSATDKNAEIEKVKVELNNISNFLKTLANFYNSSCVISDSSYDSVRATITLAQNSISTNRTELNTKLNAIASLKIALKQANEDLNLLNSGEKTEKISGQQAQIAGARARLAQANAEASKNTLEAPFSGIITAVDIKPGEFASVGGSKSISLISDNAYEIESKVSEIDVAKLSKKQKAEITFDAYGDSTKFDAVISNISPAGVITDGVPTYKTIFSFLQKDEKIKSGMTANIKVTTNVHENVLTVPMKAIITTNGQKQVKVKVSDKIELKTIKTDTKGSNGEIEVTEGLNEGDVVVIEK